MIFYKEENGLDIDNLEMLNDWIWKQIEASIRTIFMKYDVDLPKMVFIQEFPHDTIIKIVRSNIDNVEQASKWVKKRVFIEDELMIQAKANSLEDYDEENYVKYKFEII